MLHVGVLEWFPAHLVGLEVDHAAPGHGGRGRLLQVRRLEDQVHLIGHLDNLTAHQAQLQTGTWYIIAEVAMRCRIVAVFLKS